MSQSDNHGQSPASWTGTIIILVGCLLIAVGSVWVNSWMWILGGLITLAGIVAWIVMERAQKEDHSEHTATRG